MFCFVAIFFGFLAILMIAGGGWIFLAKKVNVSFLRRYFLLGPWLTTLKKSLGIELGNYYLKGWTKNLLGLFLLIAGFLILYTLWLVVKNGLIIF
jgi:hypothetical protein